MASEPQPSSSLPLFYRRPAALQSQIHLGLSVKRRADFGFARDTNAIPLAASEFFSAQRYYPIVFTRESPAAPLAIVGLRDGRNIFVDEGGQWTAGAYVPAYVRRYPFLFAENPETKQLTLCVDEECDLLEAGDGNPLFDAAGQTAAAARQALDFCLSYQQNYEATIEFTRALATSDLLVDRDARINVKSEDFVLFRGFRMIDEERFNRLPPETLLAWRQRGWLGLVYAHLMSLGAWETLVRLAVETPETAAA